MINKFFPILLFIFVFQFTVFPQQNTNKGVEKYSCVCENKTAVREYFEQLENQQNFITQCERENEERRILLNLPMPKVISHQNSLAVSLVKPYYPKTAKRLGIFGEVLVEVITDEKGNVIYSKIINGNGFLRESVRKASCFSRFTPVQYCGKPIKTRWFIKYNFIAN